MYLPDFGCSQTDLDEMCDLLDEIIASGDDGDGVTTVDAFFAVDDECSIDPDDDGDEICIDTPFVHDRDRSGIGPLLEAGRAAWSVIGEPSGEDLLAYHRGELSPLEMDQMAFILSLRPDLQQELAVRVEMAQQAALRERAAAMCAALSHMSTTDLLEALAAATIALPFDFAVARVKVLHLQAKIARLAAENEQAILTADPRRHLILTSLSIARAELLVVSRDDVAADEISALGGMVLGGEIDLEIEED